MVPLTWYRPQYSEMPPYWMIFGLSTKKIYKKLKNVLSLEFCLYLFSTQDIQDIDFGRAAMWKRNH